MWLSCCGRGCVCGGRSAGGPWGALRNPGLQIRNLLGGERFVFALRHACLGGIVAENAGLEGSVVVNDVRKAKAGQGLNAATNEIVDLVAAGVIDPAMVTRSALQNAASIAKNILTTEAIVAEVPEKEAAGGGGGGMPDMSGMM